MKYVYPFSKASAALIKAVWEKGSIIPDYDQKVWRWDKCGRVMNFFEHGNTESEYGWEIDHIVPSSILGSEAISNFQPLNWKNNRKKGDTFPWDCVSA